jgi:hypothetical protein
MKGRRFEAAFFLSRRRAPQRRYTPLMADSPPPAESQDAINQREWENPLNWSGPFGAYSSTLDDRLWVPKRPMHGAGQAINVAHPGARVVIAGLCIMPAALVLALIILAFAR